MKPLIALLLLTATAAAQNLERENFLLRARVAALEFAAAHPALEKGDNSLPPTDAASGDPAASVSEFTPRLWFLHYDGCVHCETMKPIVRRLEAAGVDVKDLNETGHETGRYPRFVVVPREGEAEQLIGVKTEDELRAALGVRPRDDGGTSGPATPAPEVVISNRRTAVCNCVATGGSGTCYCLQEGVACRCSARSASIHYIGEDGRATGKTGGHAQPPPRMRQRYYRYDDDDDDD